MIGIDTKILLRLWLNDDPALNTRIDAPLAAHGGMPGSLLVTDVVWAESAWTLKSGSRAVHRVEVRLHATSGCRWVNAVVAPKSSGGSKTPRRRTRLAIFGPEQLIIGTEGQSRTFATCPT